MAILSLFDKKSVLSNLWEDNNSFTIKSEIKTIVPIMAKEAAMEIVAVVVAVVVATVVVVVATVVVVVVTVVIISSSTPICNA